MVQKTESYVDTSAFIAFLDKSDSFHALFRRLFSKPPALVTSSLVVAEGHGWFLRRYDQHRALQFLAFLSELPVLSVLPFDSAGLTTASLLLRKYTDQQLTLADAHGLALMNQRKVAICWSTDWHMTLNGASLVI